MESATELAARFDRLGEMLDQHPVLPWIETRDASGFAAQLLQTLARMDAPSFRNTLGLLLSQRSHTLRALGLEALRARPTPELVDGARRGLQDPHPIVRATAAWALEHFADESSYSALLEVRDADEEIVKQRAVATLTQCRDPRSIPLLVRWMGCAEASPDLRISIAQSLGTLADDAAVPTLLRMLQDETNISEVRAAMALALGRISCKDSLRQLTRATADSCAAVRAAAILGLALARASAAPGLAMQMFDHDSTPRVRAAALEALCMCDRQGLRHACKALSDQHPEVRARAVHLVAAYAPPNAAQFLTLSCNDTDAAVASLASECLARFQVRSLKVPAAAEQNVPAAAEQNAPAAAEQLG